ncbi:MAG TPA: winged helix-turn-helix domain-containing protein, partial [Fervidobacterium sp.]|nr:winged helix-turn-helix domain-containing protein [Fervidobacterium sp.]
MIPSYEDLMLPMLKFLSDGREHSMKEVEDYLADQFNVTDAERLQRYEKSGAPIFKDKVSWARTYLLKAKLIDAPRRG